MEAVKTKIGFLRSLFTSTRLPDEYFSPGNRCEDIIGEHDDLPQDEPLDCYNTGGFVTLSSYCSE